MFFLVHISILICTVNCSTRDLPAFALLRKSIFQRLQKRSFPLWRITRAILDPSSQQNVPELDTENTCEMLPGGSSDSHVSHRRVNG